MKSLSFLVTLVVGSLVMASPDTRTSAPQTLTIEVMDSSGQALPGVLAEMCTPPATPATGNAWVAITNAQGVAVFTERGANRISGEFEIRVAPDHFVPVTLGPMPKNLTFPEHLAVRLNRVPSAGVLVHTCGDPLLVPLPAPCLTVELLAPLPKGRSYPAAIVPSGTR